MGSIRYVFSLSSRLDEELMPGLMNSARREITRARVLRASSQDSKSNVPFSFAHPPALTTLPSQTHLPLRVRSSAPFRIFLADSSLRRSTVVLPPIACNTQIDCRHPCIRASECGHPQMPHACHEDPACPPCPFLMEKACACGKKRVANVRCSQDQKRVSCGTPCGKYVVVAFFAMNRVADLGFE